MQCEDLLNFVLSPKRQTEKHKIGFVCTSHPSFYFIINGISPFTPFVFAASFKPLTNAALQAELDQ